ncbi:hypothetical protein OKW45_004219 [Paraburkholderia sp. WSM4175]
MPTGLRTSERTGIHGAQTPRPAIPANCESGDRRLPGAKPVNIELEDGGKTRTSVQRRHGDSASPILHVIFAHTQPLRCACRTDAGACQCPVEACGQGALQAVIPGTALEMTDTLGMSIHLSHFSQIIFFATQHRLFRCRPNLGICHDGLMTPCCLFAGTPDATVVGVIVARTTIPSRVPWRQPISKCSHLPLHTYDQKVVRTIRTRQPWLAFSSALG